MRDGPHTSQPRSLASFHKRFRICCKVASSSANGGRGNRFSVLSRSTVPPSCQISAIKASAVGEKTGIFQMRISVIGSSPFEPFATLALYVRSELVGQAKASMPLTLCCKAPLRIWPQGVRWTSPEGHRSCGASTDHERRWSVPPVVEGLCPVAPGAEAWWLKPSGVVG